MPEVLWISPAPNQCDLCDAPITTEFYDARTRYRVWAILCEPCFHKDGVGLGLGCGQKYEKKNGQFVKVSV